MKNLFTIIISLLLASVSVTAQNGFIIEYLAGGPLYNIDLTNAQKTLVGNTMNNLGAGDFGANEVLYAINSSTNQFYQIDTTNGTTTLIGSITPPANHMWTGMAYDEANDIMYGYSAHAIAAGEGSLHIIDVSNGSYTLVGTQTTATAIGCIAIDGTGQMYGMHLSGLAKIYQIDITNGSVSLIGNIGQSAAGMGHGMDWCNADQTMYLVTYNSVSWENTLRTVNLTNGSTTQVGGLLGGWMGLIAIPGSMSLSADFSSDVTDVCAGGVVNYTDQSSAATSWSWTFEGGTPATSTDQNPTVNYNTTGVFDVTLIVSDGQDYDTLEVSEMITVQDIPNQPITPSGPDNTCADEEYTYTTMSVDFADTYVWEVLPSDAGIITGSDTSAIFESDADWTGSYTIKVMASNDCGSSTWSTELNCTLNYTPLPYVVSGSGGYCEGGQGREVTLNDSEVDVDYELFYEDVSTGIIVAGTGNSLSFGYQTDEGLYNVYGLTSTCSTLMFGEAYISIDYTPVAGTLPTGPEEVCSNTITDYQTSAIPDSDTLVWILSPTESGEIIGSGENISIEWSSTYNGLAYLSVYGSNYCGDGDPSDELEINVSETPTPEVIGDTLVCKNNENIYSTTYNSGNTYSWEVVGGNIVSGAGTNEINILWTTIGPGTILVTETSDTCEGTSDTFKLTIDDCTGIVELTDLEINLYPNPAKDQLNISFTSKNAITFEIFIYNSFGQVVSTTHTTTNIVQGSHQINISSLATGLYFVSMKTSSNKIYQARFEIIK